VPLSVHAAELVKMPFPLERVGKDGDFRILASDLALDKVGHV